MSAIHSLFKCTYSFGNGIMDSLLSGKICLKVRQRYMQSIYSTLDVMCSSFHRSNKYSTDVLLYMGFIYLLWNLYTPFRYTHTQIHIVHIKFSISVNWLVFIYLNVRWNCAYYGRNAIYSMIILIVSHKSLCFFR